MDYIRGFFQEFAVYAIVIVGLVWISKRFPTKYRCKICTRECKDILASDISHTIGPFCRNHLVQEYSKEYLNTSFNKVVVEYQPHNGEYRIPQYAYFPISEIEKFGWNKNAKLILEELLASINSKKCEFCDSAATTLFVSRGAAHKSNYGYPPSLDYTKNGKYLCNEHAIKSIIPSIQNNPKYFDDPVGGLWIPHKEQGIQVGAEV